MKYNYIIFDLDGTLLNTLDDLRDSTNFALRRFGFPERTTDEVRRFVGNGVARLIHLAVPEGTDEKTEADCLAVFKAHYKDNMTNKTAPYPGIMELLKKLRALGVKIAVAVVILYIMQFSGKKESSVTRTFASAGDTTALLPIAYVNVDSLLLNYNYSKDLNEIILKKQENSRANITQKARSLQGEMQDFQRKVENNAFLTRERAEQEQQRLLNKQQELQNLDNQLAQELMQEQQKLNEQLRDTVVSQLKAFNLGRGYQVVFSNTVGDNILLAGDSYDITGELLEYLNKNYSSPAK